MEGWTGRLMSGWIAADVDVSWQTGGGICLSVVKCVGVGFCS